MSNPYPRRREEFPFREGALQPPPSSPTFTPNPGYQPPPSYAPGPSYGQYQQPYAPRPGAYQYPPTHAYQKPRRRRRVFLWVFLAVQALFVAWLVTGLATVHTGPTSAQLASECFNHNWFPLFKSQADCVTHYGNALQEAGNVGKGIGAALIVAAWVAVDLILGISYAIYRVTRKGTQS